MTLAAHFHVNLFCVKSDYDIIDEKILKFKGTNALSLAKLIIKYLGGHSWTLQIKR